ncbi:hypothetical protein L6164_015028 [Bauhinia variegata]|uniref:Uncharacterized protein n=1 Tax=Bauhinia variegata TaxID=167791 RepID=A0ACB9NJ81_BAUVA|nr:hypothetical protein L6164_015028 [Bauhinia variegata]
MGPVAKARRPGLWKWNGVRHGHWVFQAFFRASHLVVVGWFIACVSTALEMVAFLFSSPCLLSAAASQILIFATSKHLI